MVSLPSHAADRDCAESGFIEQDRLDGDELADTRAHRRLDRLQAEGTERDAREIARELKERYRRNRTSYDGSANFSDRKANVPGPADPKLWQVRCKTGSERNIVSAIFLRLTMRQMNGAELDVYSAFQRDSLPGMIFVEAFRAQHVQDALQGISNVYLAQNAAQRQGTGPNPIQLVERNDMEALLRMKKKQTDVKVGMWVRIKRGTYANDLAKIKDLLHDGQTVAVDLVPRIDFNTDKITAAGASRGKKGARPPQRLFNKDHVQQVFGRNSVIDRRTGKEHYIYKGEEYIKGLLDKEFTIKSLQLDNVNPTLDEISRFHGDADDQKTLQRDLEVIAKQKQAVDTILPGDRVEATEGEVSGLKGLVDSISRDVVLVRSEDDGQLVEMSIKSVRKIFRTGDHVKVMQGRNTDDSGLVLGVEGSIVTFWSDLGQKEVQAFAKDLRVAAEVGASNNRVGQYELHDLVMVDPTTAGVIFQVERDAFKVLDQNGSVRSLRPHQIGGKPMVDSKRSVGLDRNDHDFRVGDQMKEADGENRRGVVLHIHRGLFTFLHSRESTENNGIFVVRSKNLIPLDARAVARSSGPDLTKQDPSLNKMLPTGLSSTAANFRHLINTPVVVIGGTQKGLRGVIKDTTGDKARVELATNNKVVTLPFARLKRKDPITGVVTALDMKRAGAYQLPSTNVTPSVPGAIPAINPYTVQQPSVTPYAANPYSATPFAGGAVGATPNPYAMGGRTPAVAFGQTPNPYAQGGRTPAAGLGAATPNPYAQGGQTPAWGLGGQTPYGR